jgi:ubiquinone biosynthesis protein
LRAAPEQQRGNIHGVNCNRFARRLLDATLTQIFYYQFFHADLHPGNLIALPDNVVGFVDFGLCSHLDEMVREQQMRYLSAIYSGDPNRMFKAMSEVLVPSDETDFDIFRAEFIAEASTWAGRERTDQHIHHGSRLSKSYSPVAQSLIGAMRVARRNKLQVPRKILSMYRAILTAETVASQLSATVDLRSVGGKFFSSLRHEEALLAVEPERLEGTLLSLISLVQNSPGQVEQILSELSEGRFELKVSLSEGHKFKRSYNQRLRLLVCSILAVSLALLLTRPVLPMLFGVSSAWLIAGVLIVLYIFILIQWLRLR